MKWAQWISPVFGSCILILYFIAQKEFFAYHWLELALIALPVFVVFLSTFIASIIFCVRYRKDYKTTCVPFAIHIVAIIIAWNIPSSSFSKKYPQWTELGEIYKADGHSFKIYKEYYLVSIGTIGGSDMYAEYLTDSVNFRQYLGNFQEYGEHINLKFDGDSVIITNPVDKIEIWDHSQPDLPKQRNYNLKELQQQHKFD